MTVEMVLMRARTAMKSTANVMMMNLLVKVENASEAHINVMEMMIVEMAVTNML